MADSTVITNGINQSIVQNLEATQITTDAAIKSIDLTLKAIAGQDGIKLSQSAIQDLVAAGAFGNYDRSDTPNRRDVFEERRQSSRNNQQNNSGPRFDADRIRNLNRDQDQWERELERLYSPRRSRHRSNSFDSFMDSWESELKKSLFKSAHPFKDALRNSVQGLAKRLGVSTEDLAKEVGGRLGKMAGDAFKNTSIGRKLTEEWNGIVNGVSNRIGNFFGRIGDRLTGTNSPADDVIGGTAQDVTDAASSTSSLGHATESFADDIAAMSQSTIAANQAFNGITREAGATASAITESGAASSVVAETVTETAGAFPALTVGLVAATGAFSLLGKAVGVAINIFEKLAEWSFEPIKEGVQQLTSLFTKAATKTESRNSRYLQLWRERLEKDITSLREASYNVIKESAQRVTSVWDNVLTTVTATQGYTKAGMQTLWSSYASRLSAEGLSSVVSSADIMEKLESVLESGLSGKVAEEFAYQATVLNSAIPTEDFFQYASTYASIAANAIKSGATQQEALDKATEELKSFASNLLYASREIAGGFTTSLSNASSLFEQSAKIALTSRRTDTADISGVLTSVSAIVGAIAPDLADSLVTAVVDAATGGNSSNLTALRSMAGTGASNTAFLEALSEAPQEVFSTLFRNLAELQNMSAENYMEVADALSEVFGLSRDAFARVDFAYLADAITAMNVNDKSLNENMELLKDGQTTSTASQMKMQKINEYMIEEGLAYVLDNEAARSIQEHMWEEQMMRDLVDSTFAVDFAGTAYQAIQSIIVGVSRIAKLVSGNLFSDTFDSFKLTALTMSANADEIKEVVSAGVVGRGNQEAFQNLTTGFKDLQLVGRYGALLTGSDNFSARYAMIQEAEDNYKKQNATWFDKIMAEAGYEDENKLLESIVGQGLNSAAASAYADIAEGVVTQGVDEAFSAISNETLPMSGEAYLANLLLNSRKESIKDVIASSDEVQDLRKQAEDAYYEAVAKSRSGTSARIATQDDLGSKYSYSMVSKSTAAARQSSTPTAAAYVTKWDPSETLEAITDGALLTGTIKTNLSNYFKSDARESAGTKLRSLRMDTLGHRGYLTQEELVSAVADIQQTSQAANTSFKGWTQELEQSLNKTYNTAEYKGIEEILADYGADISQLEALYNQYESIQESAESKARELHEVQFWEDMQNFATKDFPEYMRQWQSYFIEHNAYGNETAGVYVDKDGNAIVGDAFNDSSSIGSLMMASEQGQGDAILALAQMLTDNATYQNKSLEQLKDPTLQTNAILSKILLTVEAIFQQNNEVSVVSVPTSLSALGLGVTNT